MGKDARRTKKEISRTIENTKEGKIDNGNNEMIGLKKKKKKKKTPADLLKHTYLSTPLLGQDMTQGQFLSGV